MAARRSGCHHARVADDAERESVTRGFLFADLRGYTEYVERHGGEAAARLLARYRELVRGQVARFHGAEIKTEGDSFYVVFPSVSPAVRAGLAILDDAQVASADDPEHAIRVGIGVHAGETVETAEGYVGTPVNIAARLCSLARADELLVSDTVRALTSTVVRARFIPRGRQHLKGIAEPIQVFAVSTSAAPVTRRARPRMRTVGPLLGAGAAVVAVAVVGRPGVRELGTRRHRDADGRGIRIALIAAGLSRPFGSHRGRAPAPGAPADRDRRRVPSRPGRGRPAFASHVPL